MQTVATFSDGSIRDVTRLAVYEPANPIMVATKAGAIGSDSPGETTVMVRYLNQHKPARVAFIDPPADFEWVEPAANNYVDQNIDAKLKSLQMNPSPVIDDAGFIRRASLDRLGILPTADEAQTFAKSSAVNKRARLVEQLLERPEFSGHWALGTGR